MPPTKRRRVVVDVGEGEEIMLSFRNDEVTKFEDVARECSRKLPEFRRQQAAAGVASFGKWCECIML